MDRLCEQLKFYLTLHLNYKDLQEDAIRDDAEEIVITCAFSYDHYNAPYYTAMQKHIITNAVNRDMMSMAEQLFAICSLKNVKLHVDNVEIDTDKRMSFTR